MMLQPKSYHVMNTLIGIEEYLQPKLFCSIERVGEGLEPQ